MVKEALKQFIINLPGWHTNRKILVIESDDWGSIRMPSNKVRERLDNRDYVDVSDRFNKYDTLASSEDLEALFDLLKKFKDCEGNHPSITANCVMGNPDFDFIRRENFEKYEFESLRQTFESYKNEKALQFWNEGMKEGVFIPQFHGREHVNVPFWLEKLRDNHLGVRAAFDLGVFGASFASLGLRKANFQAAWDFENKQQAAMIEHSIKQGLELFKNQFGYSSITAIPPAYTWSPKQEKILFENGVQSIQTIALQKQPDSEKEDYKRIFRYTKKGKDSIGYTQRNVFLEIAGRNKDKTLNETLKRIQMAFKCQKPAIIGSHRVNFIGGLSPQNRQENLEYLNALLKTVVERWPDVEFMSSVGLQNVMHNESKTD